MGVFPHQLIQAVADAPSLFYRLVLLVGPPGAGKTAALENASAKNEWPLISVNLMLSELLLDFTQTQRALKAAELFVMPSLYEGFGMSVLEAMACGTPSIVSDIESLKQVAGDSVEYFDPLDSEKIAQKIQLLIENSEKKEQMEKKGIERAKGFSWEKCAEETLKVYKEITEKKVSA